MPFDDRIRSALKSVDTTTSMPEAASALPFVLRSGRARRLRRLVVACLGTAVVAAGIVSAGAVLMKRDSSVIVSTGAPHVSHPEAIPSQLAGRQFYGATTRYQISKGTAHGRRWTAWAFDARPPAGTPQRCIQVEYVGYYDDVCVSQAPDRPTDPVLSILIGPDLDRQFPDPDTDGRRVVAVVGSARLDVAAVRVRSPWAGDVTIPTVLLDPVGGRVFATILAFRGPNPTQPDLDSRIIVEAFDADGHVIE